MAGHAVGGGLALGLCCDLVLLGRESRYGCPFTTMGFTPGMGTTRLLELAFGPYVAAEMMFGGEMVRGSRFEHAALVNRVLPRAEVARHARKLAARIADRPRHVLALLKQSLGLPKRLAFEQALVSESQMHALCFANPQTRALIEERYEDP
jgi:polyketide biosynthesis enoyl-CoA hydratase PksI